MSRSVVHVLIALLVLAGLIFLNVTGVLNDVLDVGRRGTEFLITPFTAVFSPVANVFKIATSLRGLLQENEILNKQVSELTAEVARLERFRLENNELRESLGFQQSARFNLVPAEVITLDPLGQKQRAVINRGKKHGINQGDAVVVSGNVLVGVVVSVFELTSEMELITSSRIAINAQSSSGAATGVIRGEHGLGLLFDLVSQNEVITVGDRLLTSGLGGQFPKNLLIGEIADIRSSSSELFQKATVIPATNLKNLRVVFIIK